MFHATNQTGLSGPHAEQPELADIVGRLSADSIEDHGVVLVEHPADLAGVVMANHSEHALFAPKRYFDSGEIASVREALASARDTWWQAQREDAPAYALALTRAAENLVQAKQAADAAGLGLLVSFRTMLEWDDQEPRLMTRSKLLVTPAPFAAELEDVMSALASPDSAVRPLN